MSEQNIHPFIARLKKLADGEERGALAALRRGLGRAPGTAAEMFRYVEPFLPQRRGAAQEAAYYLVASLFGLHPKSSGTGNMGTHLAQTRSEGGDDALERRFTALLSAHPDDLPNYLRQAVSFLKSKEVAVNWNQLFWDLQNWDDEERNIQKRWASAFWGHSQRNEETNP